MANNSLIRRVWMLAILCGFAASGCSDAADLSPDVDFNGLSVNDYPVFNESAALREQWLVGVQIQDSIWECMKKEGFGYTKSSEPFGSGLNPDVEEDLISGDLSDADFASTYGFGFSTVQKFDFTPDDQLGEENQERRENAANSAYEKSVDGLSNAERAEFDNALFGTSNDDLGCESKAQEENDWSFRYEQVRERVESAKQKFGADGRIIDHYKPWSECMRTAGYPFDTPLSANAKTRELVTAALVSDSEEQFLKSRQAELSLAVATVECGASSRSLVDIELQETWDEYIKAALE